MYTLRQHDAPMQKALAVWRVIFELSAPDGGQPHAPAALYQEMKSPIGDCVAKIQNRIVSCTYREPNHDFPVRP